MWLTRSVAAAVLLGGALGCASVDKAGVGYADAEAALEVARNAGAEEHAPAALAVAEERLQQAELAVEDNDEKRARMLVEEAIAAAELAEAEALSEKSQLAAQAVQENLRALESELSR